MTLTQPTIFDLLAGAHQEVGYARADYLQACEDYEEGRCPLHDKLQARADLEAALTILRDYERRCREA